MGDEIARRAQRWDYLWLAGISLMMLLCLLPFSSYVASLPFIQAEWEMTNAQSGLVFSIYLVGYALSSLFFLPATDSLGAAV
ncbi:MAG: multidrug effflux MFS transporter [Caldilineaceae bacterium]|nr:multidrug effflux MFS transporter [Caldilineaceae bacterium]